MTQRLKRHSIIYLFKIISKFEKKIARFLPSMGWTHPPPYLSPGGTYLKIAPKIPNNFPWGPSMTDFRSLLCSVWAIRERGGGGYEKAVEHLLFGRNFDDDVLFSFCFYSDGLCFFSDSLLLFWRHRLLFCHHPLISCRHPLLFRRYPRPFRRHPLIFCRHSLLYFSPSVSIFSWLTKHVMVKINIDHIDAWGCIGGQLALLIELGFNL